LNFLFVLCEASQAKIIVFNAAAVQVASYATNGVPGPNIYPADITRFSHGIYYYFVQTRGASGDRKSKRMKFAVVRSP